MINEQLLIINDKFDINDFTRLLDERNTPLALWVKGYVQTEICKKILNKFSERDFSLFSKYSFYADDIAVGRLGMAFGETCLDQQLREQYFNQALSMRLLIRSLSDPFLSPVDKLMLDLDTLWKKGAVIPEMYGQRMLCGIYRAVMAGGQITPHQDSLNEEHPESEFKPKKDLVSNIFIEIPENSGGEFQVWDFRPKYYQYFTKLYNDQQNKHDYHISEQDIDKLNSIPSVTIKPNVGDLVIFNPENVHQVKELKSGIRITSSFHIGYMGNNKSLLCWS